MRSISFKLILAFLIVGLIGSALVALFAVLNTRAQFNRFVADQNREGVAGLLADYYEENGSWDGLNEALSFFRRPSFRDRRGIVGQPGFVQVLAMPLLLDNDGRVVLAGAGYNVGELAPESVQKQGIPVLVDGQEVGQLVLPEGFNRLLESEIAFLDRVNRVVIFSAIGATVVALVLGILLARTLTRPLRELTAATRSVAQGNLEVQVPVRSEDELGQLAVSFNQMNAELARSRDLRRQMTADVAHELRTPLSIILGHAEALNEGVLPADPETLAIIHDETRRLNRLVDDLRTLSLAEAGEMNLTRRMISPAALLKRAAAAHAPQIKRQGIDLDVEASPDLADVDVDPDRIAQVLDNLLGNAIRYTPAGGRIGLSAKPGPLGVRFTVDDSGPGVSADELPNLFERFYRGDKSRQRGEGNSGLGLAIARSIVEAHGGRISADSQPGQGLAFNIDLSSSS